VNLYIGLSQVTPKKAPLSVKKFCNPNNDHVQFAPAPEVGIPALKSFHPAAAQGPVVFELLTSVTRLFNTSVIEAPAHKFNPGNWVLSMTQFDPIGSGQLLLVILVVTGSIILFYNQHFYL
jgi:hypothetical protein